MVAVLFIVFLVALAIGVPVAFSLGLASVAYMLGSHIQMINFAQYFFKGLDSFTLLCIPGFTFAGNLMNQGGISDKLLDCRCTGRPRHRRSGLCKRSGLHGLCRHLRHGSVRHRRSGRR